MASTESHQTSSRGALGKRTQRAAQVDGAARAPVEQNWDRFAFLLYGLAGSVLAWAALPPLGLWPLAWLAPLPWLLLVQRQRLAGRRRYLALWLASMAFWLPTLYWLTFPHPATSIGWLALATYLACYLPVFVGLGRVAVHQLHVPLLIAAPVIWTGLELAQAHLLTGVNIATLGHSQYRWTTLIQISDLCGGYTVSFLIVLVAACAVSMLPVADGRWRWWPTVPAALAVAAALVYGQWRLAGEHIRPGIKVALIQGSIDIDMKLDPKRIAETHEQYFDLSRRAVREHPDLDLLVWPETMFRYPLIVAGENPRPVPDDEPWTVDELHARVDEGHELLADVAEGLGVPLLLGMDTLVFGDQHVDRFNSAVLLDRQGAIRGRYDKMRPVLFGEYIPLGSYWPWIYRLTPLANGLSAGPAAESLAVAGARLAPNICFETFLPHFTRGQVAALRARGEEPDALVNLTNDGWFRGSSELDLHLIAGVFRAVECRKPLLVAANTGFSAVIDGEGRIEQQGPRRATGILVQAVPLDDRSSPYVRLGDWGAGVCLTFVVVVAILAMHRWRSERRLRFAATKQ